MLGEVVGEQPTLLALDDQFLDVRLDLTVGRRLQNCIGIGDRVADVFEAILEGLDRFARPVAWRVASDAAWSA